MRVHLDYIIPRESIRFKASQSNKDIYGADTSATQSPITYHDLEDKRWFSSLRKPDFQRETNAWTPQQCVEFLQSVTEQSIIPSIILWTSPDNGFTYILDGAHRLSVIKAWITDDWGDKNDAYYDRKDKNEVKEAASEMRKLINAHIGSYQIFYEAYERMNVLTDEGKTPMQDMGEKEFQRACFYRSIFRKTTIPTQWEKGDYDKAESSFLRINRQGQALDPWEANLIEYRSSSYSRVVSSIANGGKAGHFWPVTNDSSQDYETVKVFQVQCGNIHAKLFVPPFKHPISDLNVPIMVSPAYFQKHKYLLELIPIIVYNEIAIDEDKQLSYLKHDVDKDVDTIIKNSKNIIDRVEEALEHIVGSANNSLSLSIVPLFYWYNERGQYNRSLFYGFMYWLLSGKKEDIKLKKMVFSVFRDKFEYVLYEFKSELSSYLNASSGAGLKSAKQTANFIQNILNNFLDKPNVIIKSEDFEGLVLESLGASSKSKKTMIRTSKRFASPTDQTQVHIREMFENSIKCHICGGIVNLSNNGLQYDHVEDYAKVKNTSADNLKPTHPYCNNNKHKILAIRDGKEPINLPNFNSKQKQDTEKKTQLSFWGNDSFPL